MQETRIATITLADDTTGVIYAVMVLVVWRLDRIARDVFLSSEEGGYQLQCEHEDGSREDCNVPIQDTLDDCRIAAQQSWGIGDWGLELIDD